MGMRRGLVPHADDVSARETRDLVMDETGDAVLRVEKDDSTMRIRFLSQCPIVAIAWLLWLSCTSTVLAGPLLSKSKDCICKPNPMTYGYFAARWRPWPQQDMFGIPTPAVMRHGETSEPIEAEPEELPDLTPPSNQDLPEPLPQEPATPSDTQPDDTQPEALPENTLPDAPDTTPPQDDAPASIPEAEPATPSLPPATPGTLPEDPLAPPAELDDDPAPALPQSLLEPESERGGEPRLTRARGSARPTRYQSPASSGGQLDETGLPSLPLSNSVSKEAKSKDGRVAPGRAREQAPELLEPAPVAQPVDAGDASTWNRRRLNPLRGASRDRTDVQQAAHWQATARVETATPRVAPVTNASPLRNRAADLLPARVNPLRGGAGGQ
jgi:hypothetical protein